MNEFENEKFVLRKKVYPFVQYPRALADDHNLSLGALGLMAYLMCRFSDGTALLGPILAERNDSEEDIRSYLDELVNAGLVDTQEV